MTIGDRLREERKKLKLQQPDVADLIGKVRKTVIDYEKNYSSPDASVLAVLASAGFDVYYIITGVRVNAAAEPVPCYELRPDLQELLKNVELCSKEDSNSIKRMAKLAARDAEAETSERAKKVST